MLRDGPEEDQDTSREHQMRRLSSLPRLVHNFFIFNLEFDRDMKTSVLNSAFACREIRQILAFSLQNSVVLSLEPRLRELVSKIISISHTCAQIIKEIYSYVR